MKNVSNEIWKEIRRLPGYYVSNYGNVRSTKSGISKPIKIVENNHGYYLCCLYHNKKRHTSYVHRLVAEAFIPTNHSTFTTSEVNHKDKNTKNNHVSNLEWTTHMENTFHRNDPERYFLMKRIKDHIDGLTNDELRTMIDAIIT